MLEFKDGNWVITVGEIWGPLPCEQKDEGCDKNSFAFILNKEERKKINKKFGSRMVRFILDNKLGKVICQRCLEKKIKEIGMVSPLV
jgi:hypothetical protein